VERERDIACFGFSGTMIYWGICPFNFTLKLNQPAGVPATDVAAQINFNIKLKYEQERLQMTSHEGVGTPFNFHVKLECAPTSVGMLFSTSINFYIKLKCAATSVNGVGGA
jgi:hypothetical protein